MSLAAGTRLGPYEVLGLIGAGGMGEVYKARDTRLDRTVALKVLPAELAADAERRTRFEREARTISTLSHPHICTLHDVGDHDGLPYLVMEHLAGETLAERLQKGPLPLDQVFDLGAQIADALSAAHKAGIVHRDLKPGNVMLTKTGAKLLDFGLAKLRPAEGVRLLRDSSATVTQGRDVTAAGTLVGTLPYMAPEQIEGREADARTDLWALGCLLYEMVTGQRAFEGATTGSLVGAILAKEPAPLASRQPLTPPSLERLVKRCLAKDSDQRWDSAHDVADELRWLREMSSTTALPGAPSVRRWGLRAALVAAGGFALVLVGAGALWWTLSPGPASPPRVERFTISLAGTGLAPPQEVAISPDGHTVVFRSTDGGPSRLFVRRLDQWTATPLDGTEEAGAPRFSPDGAWVVFASPTGLMRVRVGGGPPVPMPIDEASAKLDPKAPSWEPGPDGRIVVSVSAGFSLWRVSLKGGAPELLLAPENREGVTRYLMPEVLPGGGAVLFSIVQGGQSRVAAVKVATREVVPLVARGGCARFIPATGHLVYQADLHLFAVPFDPEGLRLRGEPVAVAEGVGTSRPQVCEYDVSPTGTLVHTPRPVETLAWRDRQGTTTRLALKLDGRVQYLSLAPDGRRAVVCVQIASMHRIFVASLEGDAALTRLTPGDDDWYGNFDPGGRRVFFTSPAGQGAYNVFSTRADGGGDTRPETVGPGYKKASSVGPGPSGDLVLFNDLLRPGGAGIWQQRLGRPETAQPLVDTDARELEAAFSPDGRWIAYQSNASGRNEIYVQGHPTGPRTVVSADGGECPRWNPRGGELFYRQGNAVFVVRVVNGARVGAAVRLFDLPTSASRNWDVAPDGERFLVMVENTTPQIHVITNWFEELKAKVPAP